MIQDQKDLLIEALQGGIKKTINKHGQETAEKQLLITTYKQLQAARASDSSTIGMLKKLVTKQTVSASVVKNHTSGSLTSTNPVVFYEDPEVLPIVSSNSSDTSATPNPCGPTIRDTLKDKWTTIEITASKCAVTANYTIINEYEQTQTLSKEKQGKWPFRYRSPVIQITNKNPNTKTDEISAWAVQVPNVNKKVTQGVVAGALAGFVIGLILIK